MKQLIESILQGYGSLVTLRDGQSARTFRAMIRPVTETGWPATRAVIETLGRIPKGQYVYIGPADAAIQAGARIEAQKQAFVVRQCQTRYLADKPVYVWALLVKAGGNEAWSS